MGFTRKYLSADGLVKIVQHSLLREKFKVLRDPTYTWKNCIMSGLAVFGFKMPSLLQFEKDKDSEPWLRRNLRTLHLKIKDIIFSTIMVMDIKIYAPS